jgi:hypothetical protein
LQADGAIQIAQFPSSFSDKVIRMLKQFFRINTFVLRISIGEMEADIPQGKCPKKRVTDYMQQYIRVTVAYGAV